MESNVEALEGNKVKLTIAVPESEFDTALDAAFRKIAREVRIPGFRPGKAPRRVLEARVGTGAAREEALRDSLPEYYSDALRNHEVDAVAMPEIEITAGEEAGDIEFEAVVEVRPEVEIEGYRGLRVEIDYEPVSDEAVQSQIDRLRERFADVVDSDDPLVDGSYANVDIAGRQDGEEVDGLSVTDFLYEVGSEMIVAELDEQLRGKRPGDILSFEATLPERFGDRADEEVAFSVVVKDVKRKVLPDLTDEWVTESSEFDTVEELTADTRLRVERLGIAQAGMAARDKVLEAAAEMVPIEAPESMVDNEAGRRLHDLSHRLEHQGVDLAQYLEATGRSQDDLVAEARDGARQAVLADLALRAVVTAEGIEATQAEIDEHVESIAGQVERPADQVLAELEQEGGLEAVRSDIVRSKALELLVESAVVVDSNGDEIDLTAPAEPEDPDSVGSSDQDQDDDDKTDD